MKRLFILLLIFNLGDAFGISLFNSNDFIKVNRGNYTIWTPSSRLLVDVEKKYQIMSKEVTQNQFFKVMGYNPSYFKQKKFCTKTHKQYKNASVCPKLPVENVTLKDVEQFIIKLNKNDSRYLYDLPDYFQWDKAARGILNSVTQPQKYQLYDDSLGEISWHKENSGGQTQTVGTKKPNSIGMYDIRGNVWEIIKERTNEPDETHFYSNESYKQLVNKKGKYLYMRGGAWYYRSYFASFPEVSQELVSVSTNVMGFRLVRFLK